MGNSADPIWQPLRKINQDLLRCWVFSHPEFIHELVVDFFLGKQPRDPDIQGGQTPTDFQWRVSICINLKFSQKKNTHFFQKKSAWWFQTWLLFSIGHIWDIQSFPLTNSIIFQDGHIAPPTRLLLTIINHIITIYIYILTVY